MKIVEKPALSLQQPCTQLRGVGPRVAQRLEKIHIATIQDLLFHLPFRYEDRTHVKPIRSLHVGDSALIEGEIVSTETPKFGKTRFLCQLHDGQGFIQLRFFHVVVAQLKALVPGARLRCFGEVRMGPKGWEMAHPEYQLIHEGSTLAVPDTLTPVYPTTDGLHQQSLRRFMEQALHCLNATPAFSTLPVEIESAMQFMSLTEALTYVHQPPVTADLAMLVSGKHPAQQRLAFEELLAHRLSLLQSRKHLNQDPAPTFTQGQALQQRFLASLPFALTAAQARVLQEVNADLAKSVPMLRLVQGDVGCGKTVVAALVALQAIAAGYQVAVMAPTEILAEQHMQNFKAWLAPLGIACVFLSGTLTAKQRREALQQLAEETQVVAIGTHALFQKNVEFKKLGLVIVDEQHRFGVQQRLSLREKGLLTGFYPHQLIMTATPIPRSLAMTAYADLDHSVIDELPPGRQPIKTVVIANSKRDAVIARVKQACLDKKQVYWVCTLIEESDVLQCQAAEKTAAQLQQELAGLRVGLIHGRLSAEEKETMMQSFKAGEIDLLVATTVIEVGVDVPNASLMIIENPERLGLSQLHQLRGRVGRGSLESFCLLLYQAPLSQQSQERLAVMRDYSDGFKIAEKDLEFRGPGEMLGTRQSGAMQFRVADIIRDQALIPKVQQVAAQLEQTYSDIVPVIIDRWLSQKMEYRDV